MHAVAAHRSIEFEVLFVLGELELDPGGLPVPVAVPFGEQTDGGLAPALGVEPPRRFRDEKSKDADQPGEDHLEPDGDQPGVVVVDVQASTGDARRQDGPREPGGVAEARHDGPVLGVGRLDDPDGPRGGGDGDAEPEDEPTAHHLTLGGVGGREALDDGADDDQKGADEHARATAPLVDAGADKGQGADAADLVHGRDQPRPDALVLAVEVFEKVFLVVEQAAKEHGVVTVHGLAEEPRQQDDEQQQHAAVPPRDGLLDQSFIVGLAAADLFDLDDLRAVRQSVIILVSLCQARSETGRCRRAGGILDTDWDNWTYILLVKSVDMFEGMLIDGLLMGRHLGRRRQ